MFRISLACLWLAAGCVPLFAQDPLKPADIKKLAEKMRDATLAGEYAKLIDSTYPPAVEKLGGRDKAIEAIEKGMKVLKEQGISFTSYKIEDPGEILAEGDNKFILIPTKLEMKYKKGIIKDASYLLGISSDGGKTWKFVDGAGLKNKEEQKKILPKLPEKLVLPEKGKPEFIEAP